MPSASAKLEKQASTEVPDPVKQVLTVVEKKVRNLEKRKGKLDAYKHDHQSGKELNDDQRNAIKKYDLVVELLEFAKELQKSFLAIVQENAKLQKKAAKREQVEKQQQETQRTKELLLLQDILVNMGTQEIRNDFLHGTNGALKLEEENLNQLDEFYKLISPDRSEENSNFEEQLFAAAEHLACLIDGKNKEVLTTTYKSVKELMMKINDCGYFSPAVGAAVADESTEECGKITEEENEDVPTGVTEIVRSDHRTEEEQVDSSGLSNASHTSLDTPYYSTAQQGGHTRPLQEVLPVQGTLDFLQDSQIDLQSLHMDPAVVVAHPMIPPTSIGYPVPYHSGSNHPSQDIQSSQPEIGLVGHSNVTSIVSHQQQQQQQQMQAADASNSAMPLPQQSINAGPDYDPVCPIPTQTYTNQSFAAVHPIVPVTVPGNYVPDALGHHSLQQIVPVGIVPQHVTRTLMSPQTTDAHSMPIASQASGIVPTNVNLSSQSEGKEFESEFQMQQEAIDNGSGSNRFGTSSEYQQVDDSQDYSSNQQQNFAQNRGYATSRGGRGARARAPANGYARGNSSTAPSRGGYGNGRSGYQNTGNYFQGSYAGRDNFNNNATNYSNAYKQRGSARSGGVPVPKNVNPGSRGGSNGRGGYRSQ